VEETPDHESIVDLITRLPDEIAQRLHTGGDVPQPPSPDEGPPEPADAAFDPLLLAVRDPERTALVRAYLATAVAGGGLAAREQYLREALPDRLEDRPETVEAARRLLFLPKVISRSAAADDPPPAPAPSDDAPSAAAEATPVNAEVKGSGARTGAPDEGPGRSTEPDWGD
jgi:hypothetical protein